jgi:ATP-dependent DNA ligase
MFAAACKLGLEGIVSKRLGSVYKSDPSKTWVKVENPKSPHKSHGQDVLKVG